MANRVVYSNDIEILLRHLREEINNREADVFTRDWIITQTPGISQWLAVEMAKKENNGVFANFAMTSQDGFVSELYRHLFDRDTEGNSQVAKWIIFQLLGSGEFVGDDRFRHVSEYYKEDDFKRFQLADRIADLLDQYQIYRGNLIEQWNAGQLVHPDSAMEEWQKWLWLRLVEDRQFTPRHRIAQELFEAFDDEAIIEKIKTKFPAINLFGNSIYSPYHYRLFEALAEVTDVNHFIVLPSQNLNLVTQDGNELLKRWGENHAELVAKFNLADSEQAFTEPAGDSLLGRIQRMIFNNEPVAARAKTECEAAINDNSIQVNSAYTPFREVEMLYNYLVGLKTGDAGLESRDILVMTTDMDLYAPYIKAVFDNPAFKIPFNILGVSAEQRESVISAFTGILDFEESDFTAEKVLSLLENRCIASNYGINDIEKTRALVKKANIRFGFEAEGDTEKFSETNYVSWDFGLRKLALGYAMLAEDMYSMPGVQPGLYPFTDIDVKTGEDIIKLVSFVSDLKKVVTFKKENGGKTLSEWKRFATEDVLEHMITAENEDKPDMALIYKRLNVLSAAETLTDGSGNPLTVDFRTFYRAIRDSLISEQGEFGFNSGKVTFSSFIPARGLPARVIAILGLNSALFPRRDQPFGFDLMAIFPEPGDRSKKKNDKMLFLEAVLAAKEHLYISYIGKDVKDNSPIPPSIVVDQLLDFIEGLAEEQSTVRKTLLQEHPLHGFSGKYQQDNDRLYSYLYNGNTALTFDDRPDPDRGHDVREININQLSRFLEDPVKWHYDKIMGISSMEIEDSIGDTELLEPDGLQKWELRKEFMENRKEKEILVTKLKMEGKLQLGAVGDRQFNQINEETEDLKKRYLDATRNVDPSRKLISLPVDIAQEGLERITVIVYGTVDRIFEGNKRISYCVSNSIRHKDKVRLKLDHLVITACGEVITSSCLGLKKNEDFTCNQTDREKALASISDIVRLYFESMDRLILYDDDIDKEIRELAGYEAGNNPDINSINDLKSKALGKIKKKAYPTSDYEYARPHIRQAWDEGLYESRFDELRTNTIKINDLLSI